MDLEKPKLALVEKEQEPTNDVARRVDNGALRRNRTGAVGEREALSVDDKRDAPAPALTSPHRLRRADLRPQALGAGKLLREQAVKQRELVLTQGPRLVGAHTLTVVAVGTASFAPAAITFLRVTRIRPSELDAFPRLTRAIS